MKKIYFLLLFFVFGTIARAQTTATGYTFGQSTGTYTALSGATSAISGAWTDNVVSAISIGFTFGFMGTNYSTVSISSNGWIGFGSTTLTATTYTPISVLGGGTNGVVSASGCNLQASSGSDPITYLTTGSSPNRIFTVEWKNARFQGSGATESWNFQIKLYETSNIIQVCYGSATTPATARTMQVGIRGTTVTDYNNRTTATDWSATTRGIAAANSCTRSTTVQPANGLIYSWCPNAARPTVAVSPTGSCGTYSVTASGASTYVWAPAASVSATTGSTVNVTSAGVVTVTGTATTGCSNTTNTVFGTSSTLLMASSSSTVCPSGTVTLGAGYTSASVYTVTSIAYDSVDITSGATAGPTGDDVASTATIPFTFNYFGTNYSSVNMCTNGFINFGTSSTSRTTNAFPNAAEPTGAISIFKGDLFVGAPGAITYKTVGTAPFRRFVVNFNFIGNCCSATDLYKGQIILYETTNIIDVMVFKSAAALRVLAIQNTGGTIGVGAPGRNGVFYSVTTPEGWRFAPVNAAPTYSWAPAAGLSSSTSSAPVATVTATTTYTVTMTDPMTGCTSTGTRTITLNAPTIAVAPANGCFGVNMTASGGVSYTWAPATGLSATTGATVTPTPTVATTYTVTGTNAAGCSNTATKLVNMLPTISVSPTVANYCAGGSPVTLTASGGDTYTWAAATGLSATTGSPVDASPGTNRTYTVTGTDAATGCSNTATSVITRLVAPSYAVLYDTVICFPGVTAGFTDGVGGTWSSSDTSIATIDASSGFINGITAGTVMMTYTNICGSMVDTLLVSGAGITVSVTPSSANYCASSGAIGLVASGADTFLWTPSAGIDNPNVAAVNASPSATTVYTVYGTTGTCHAATFVTITNVTPGAITGGVTTICTSGGAATTTWTSATSGGTWSSSDGGIATVNPSTGVITGISAGSANITYTVSGCFVTRAITVNSSPTLSFTPTTAANCGGAGVAVTASGASTYTWTPATGLSATTGATVTASPTVATTYTITGTTAAGCVSTGTKLVGSGAAVTAIAAVSTATVCPGTLDTLGAGLTSTSVYTVTSIAYDSIDMSSGTTAGPTGDDATSPGTIPFNFNYYGTNYTTVNICTNGFINFGTASTSLSTGAYPSVTMPSGGVAIFEGDLFVGAPGSVTYKTVGSAPFRKFVVSYNFIGNCCSATDLYKGQIILYETTNIIDIMVFKSASAVRTIAIQNIGGTIGIGAPGRNGVTYSITTPEGWRFSPVTQSPTYAWAPATGLSSTTAVGPTVTVSATTTYTVTITSPSGCSGTATRTITANAAPSVSVSPNPACFGSPMTATGATTYTWTPATAMSATTGATVTSTPTVATTYTVTGTNGAGCTDTAIVTVNTLPTLSLTPSTGCAPQAMTASGGATYTWAPAASLDATTGANVTASPTVTTTYTVITTDANGCTDTGTALVGPAPGSITGTTTSCAFLSSTLSNSTAGGVWTSSDTTIATVNSSTGVVTGVTPGTATITYTVGSCTPVTTSFVVTTSPILAISPSTGCANPTQTLVATGATTYSWAPATELDVTTGSTVVSTPTAVRTYTLTGSNGSCAVTATVTVNPAPGALTGGSTTICSGDSTTWSTSIAGGNWVSSDTTVARVNSSGRILGLTAGVATISYFFTGCAGSAATRTITINSTPILTNTSSTNCVLASTASTLSLSGGTTYSWTPATGLSATTGATVTTTITGPVTYTVTAIGTGGCSSIITVPVYTVSSVGTPTVTASPLSTCAGGSSVLSITAPSDYYTLSSISYSLSSMTSPTTGPSGDDVTGAATLPFTFNYYGTNYTQVNLCTNGFINFGGTGYTTYPAASIPNGAAPFGTIFLNWGDRWIGTPGSITYSTEGTAPNRRFVIYYNQGSNCCSFANLYSGQIILYETTNVIEVMVTNANTSGTNGTMGIQNPSATQAMVIASRNATPFNVTTAEGWRFSPNTYSYAWTPATSLSSTTSSSTTLSPAPGAGTYFGILTNTINGCNYRNSVTVTTGTMAASIAAATTAVCSGSSTTVTVTGPAGGTIFYNIDGGSTLSATIGGSGTVAISTGAMTTTRTYNLVSVTSGICSNSVSGSVTINVRCYCTPTYSSTPTTAAMNRVRTAGFGGTSLDDSYTPPAGGYIDRSTATAALSMMQGNAYAITVNYNTSAFYHNNQVWIDFNDDGTFATSEIVSPVFGVGGCTTSVSSDNSTITIPATAAVGVHRMRVRNGNTLSCTNATEMSPCATANTGNTNFYGNAADYTLTIVALPACSGTPSAGAASATVTAGCATYSSVVSVPILASGVTYQWQSSTDSSSWSTVSGATSNSVTANVSVVRLYYRCIVTCTVSGLSATSSPVLMRSTPAIVGSSTVCQSGTTTLTNALSGGTWSSSAVGVATVGSGSGIVSGVAAGSATISYATAGCTQTFAITTIGVPAAITGTTSVCRTFTTTLANTTAGGTWSSSDSTTASVTSGGVVTGRTVGTATITYSTGCGTPATASYTVNTQPSAIVGLSSVCTLSTNTYTDSISGGTWSNAPVTFGTIDASTGILSSTSTTGTTILTYSIGSCTATYSVAVGSTSPASITGTTSACVGGTSTLANATAGGVWSSSNTAIATVGTVSGVVTGVANGTATITYSSGCGTAATTTFTVNGTAVNITYSSGGLTGPVCSGGTLSINSGTTSGGTYSWTGPNSFTSTAQNPTISSVTTAASGTYTFTATVGGCPAPTTYRFIAVNAIPTITATASPATICASGTSTLTATVLPSSSNYQVNAIPFVAPTMTSPTAGPSGDDVAGSATLPFSFTYFGASYSTIFMCTNGFVNFSASSTLYPSATLPAAGGPPAAIFSHWGDRWIGTPGSITYSTEGSAPNRRFIVKFNQGSNCCSFADLYTTYIILYETTNVIELMVDHANTSGTNGAMGIQNLARTVAVPVPGRNNVPFNVTTPEGWRFSTPNYSYAWSPATALSSTTASAPVSSGLTSTTLYTVTAIDATSGCTTGNTGFDTVTVNPLPTVFTVTGDGSYCSVPGTGVAVGLSGSETGVNYRMYQGGVAVGSVVAGTGSAISFGNQTDTTYSYTVLATRALTGCTQMMNDSATIIRYTSPTAFNVTGGTGCTATGVTVGLSNSSTAATYQLYRSGGAIGSPVTGSGSSLSFGADTAAGTYTVIATGTVGGCTTTMNDSSVIGRSPNVYNITGGSACSATGITVGLSGSQSGANYQLRRTGTNIGSPIAGTGSSLSIGAHDTAGTYTILATAPSGCQLLMNGVDTVFQTPRITMGANPIVCQPISSVNISYTSPVGSPSTYNLTYDSTALAAGFSSVSGGSLSGGNIPLVIPGGTAGVFNATVTVANATCTSNTYSINVTVFAHPDAAITSVTVPCSGYSGSIVVTGTPGASIAYTIDSGSILNSVMTGGTTTLSTGAITSARVYTIIDAHNVICSTPVDTVVTITPIPMQWVGTTSSDWTDAANWSCGFVPGVNDHVSIPSGTPYAPVVTSGDTVNTNNLTLASSVNVTLGASSVLKVKGNLTNNGAVLSSGIVEINGSSAQTIGGNGTINHLKLNNATGASVAASSMVTIKGTLEITSGTLTTNDSLTLASDSSATARVKPITCGSGSISGNVKVAQYIPGGRRAFRFWAHPFSTGIPLSQIQQYIDITGTGGASNGFTTTGSNAPSAFRYNPLVSNSAAGYDPGWKDFKNAYGTPDSNMFKKHMGIRMFYRGAKGQGLSYATGYTVNPTTIYTSGPLNQCEQIVRLQKGGAANQDYNMVGNPYASPVDIGTVAHNAKVSGNIVGAAIYVWNPYLATVGQFQAVPVNTTSATPYYLQANASFQVRAANNNDSLIFNENNKNATATTQLLKPIAEFVNLQVYDANYHAWDMMYLNFDENASANEEGSVDATKPLGPDFNMYSLSADQQKLVIDSRPFKHGTIIPLGISSNYQQEFIIKADQMKLPTGGVLYLHDKLMDKYIMLQKGTEYRFAITKDDKTQGEKRFELSLEGGISSTGLDVAMTPNPANEQVAVSFTSTVLDEVAIRVIDVRGANVYTQNLGKMQRGTIRIPVQQLAAGMYMVELTQGQNKVVQRLIKE